MSDKIGHIFINIRLKVNILPQKRSSYIEL